MNNEFPNVGLYDHNSASYKKIRKSFDEGQKEVAIVHATGTGKSYNALQLAYDNKDKKIVYVVPSMAIIEHIKQIIEENPRLDLERDFPNLEFRTYQSFINLNRDEISQIPCDLLILDEFHHLGAPVWGQRIKTFLDTHQDTKVFGMTAYTVRDRGTEYERDMANPETDELFSNKVVSRYDLCDAMMEGVLPKPIYRAAYTQLIGIEREIEERVMKMEATSKEYQEYMKILADIKKRIHEAPGIPELLKKNIKPNGKYIYFCPFVSEKGTNDIETIKNIFLEELKTFIPEEDIIFYTTTAEMGLEGKKNRDAFYNNQTLNGQNADGKLRIMFAINQYNEGVHAPNIDGVIMGRGTSSDIVYFEQLGRALSVRGKTKEDVEKYEQLSVEELKELCNKRDIKYKEDVTKEELIEKLIAPVVIDLACNIEFIKELENNLKDRIKETKEKGNGTLVRRILSDAAFDIDVENIELYEILNEMYERLVMTWDKWYELAKAYYEHHGNLLIPQRFKTQDGYTYDEEGINLGGWISSQRSAFRGKGHNVINSEQIELLNQIGIVWDPFKDSWNKMYELAKAYYEHHGNLMVPIRFKTQDGYTYDEAGVNLGVWISNQRKAFKGAWYNVINSEQIELLNQIGMVWDSLKESWNKMYELAKAYYEHHGNLMVHRGFKTQDGYTYDEAGVNLGGWISYQRQAFKGKGHNVITSEQIELLNQIGMVWDPFKDSWNRMYELAKAYFEHHGNLMVPNRFKTQDGYTYDEAGVNLGIWISNQRKAFKGAGDNIINSEQIELLNQIGMVWDLFKDSWNKMYELAKAYFEHHGNLMVPQGFKTQDGYTYDEAGVTLGLWIYSQRKAFKGKGHNVINSEQIELLNQIGMVWNVKNNEYKIKEICSNYSIDFDKNKKVLDHMSVLEFVVKIAFLIDMNIPYLNDKGKLHNIFSVSSADLQEEYGVSLTDLIDTYGKKETK